MRRLWRSYPRVLRRRLKEVTDLEKPMLISAVVEAWTSLFVVLALVPLLWCAVELEYSAEFPMLSFTPLARLFLGVHVFLLGMSYVLYVSGMYLVCRSDRHPADPGDEPSWWRLYWPKTLWGTRRLYQKRWLLHPAALRVGVAAQCASIWGLGFGLLTITCGLMCGAVVWLGGIDSVNIPWQISSAHLPTAAIELLRLGSAVIAWSTIWSLFTVVVSDRLADRVGNSDSVEGRT